jgi:ABC-type lipoprotein release transport system permease subunit
VAAWALARTLAAFQYGVTVSDPVSWAVVFVALAIAALLACWRPARAAMRVNPVELLKEE